MTTPLAAGQQPAAIAWRPTLWAMGALAVVLSVASNGYGYHRDELYFLTLPPRWNYIDQPGFVPFVARLTRHLSDSLWALRIPATVCALLSVLVIVLLTREFRGDRRAQTWCAWTYAFAVAPLLFGHLFLTATVDLVLWPLLCLFAVRALLRGQPRFWVAAGAVLGLATYSKLLITLLVVALVAGLLLAGPRRVLVSRWFLTGALLAAVLAIPALVYQLTHDWPQLEMGKALRANNAAEVRATLPLSLMILLGPPLVPIWVTGFVQLIRRPDWRPVRFLAPAFVVLLVECFFSGGQLYYPVGLLVVLFAAGWVPAAGFLARATGWRRVAVPLFALNMVVAVVISLPVIPLHVLASTPVPGTNETVGDQIGWPTYVEQIADAYATIPAAERENAVIVTSNYGEWGAITRYGPAHGLPLAYSGQNQLWFDRRPPASTTIVLLVGGQARVARDWFGSCTDAGTLGNRSDVDNEEQDRPLVVCRAPDRAWSSLWRQFQHYD